MGSNAARSRGPVKWNAALHHGVQRVLPHGQNGVRERGSRYSNRDQTMPNILVHGVRSSAVPSVGALPGLKPFAVFGRPFGTSGRQCGARPNPAAGWRVSRKSHKGLCSYRDAAAIVGAESLRRFARGDDPVGGRRRIPSAKDAAATTSPAVTRSRPRFGGAGVLACARPGGNMLPRYWGPRTTGQALPRYRGPGGCRETVRQALPR